jgi:hypothetical protein
METEYNRKQNQVPLRRLQERLKKVFALQPCLMMQKLLGKGPPRTVCVCVYTGLRKQ